MNQQKKQSKLIVNELSAFSHDDFIVEVKKSNAQQIGSGGPGVGGRDRRDTGH